MMTDNIEAEYNKQHKFYQAANKTISLLANANNLSDKEVLKEIESFGIDQKDAIDIFLFMPIAFVRHLLPTFRWSDYFIDWISENEQIRLRFSESKSYQLVFRVVSEYIKNTLDTDVVLKIASRSSEFQVINDLLNKGNNIEDIKLTEAILIRK